MKIYFDSNPISFIFEGIHDIPRRAVEITPEEYAALLDGEAHGNRIDVGADGRPLLIEPAPNADPLWLNQRIAARRFQAETAGITVNGMALPTDRDSQALVTGAALAAVIDSNYTCQWKTASGFVDLSAQQIIALASAMRAHVQACFDREAALLDALAAGTYTDAQLDQGWPA